MLGAAVRSFAPLLADLGGRAPVTKRRYHVRVNAPCPGGALSTLAA